MMSYLLLASGCSGVLPGLRDGVTVSKSYPGEQLDSCPSLVCYRLSQEASQFSLLNLFSLYARNYTLVCQRPQLVIFYLYIYIFVYIYIYISSQVYRQTVGILNCFFTSKKQSEHKAEVKSYFCSSQGITAALHMHTSLMHSCFHEGPSKMNCYYIEEQESVDNLYHYNCHYSINSSSTVHTQLMVEACQIYRLQ